MQQPSSSKDLDLAPGTVVHGYTVVRSLGSGGMGDVVEATAADGRRVALKVLRAEALHEPGSRERFVREAKVCASLKSPHILPVLDHGIHRGRPLLVMPILNGSDLETWLERTGPLRPDVAIAIVLQACDALAVAHASGIVHRDLKPANIFMSQGREALTTIVCDFGVAKIVDEDGALTASGAVLGTPLYMSPEQLLDSKRVDARCDVWALGMTLYHMLSGRTAHGDLKTIADLVLALSTNKLEPIQSAAPWVSPSLARVVHTALLPRDKRFPTVQDLANALAKYGPVPAEITTATLVAAPADMRSSVAPVATLPGHHQELGITADEATLADNVTGPSQPKEDLLVGKVLGGKYRLVRKLGSGGMGAVYEGVDDAGARTAVKVMHADAGRDDDATRRFTREMKAARAIDSPYVVKPIDFGVDEIERIPYFVMELLEGRDLASVVATVGSLAPAAAVELFVQACSALAAAHALGIVHRDIKPSNLFLHEPGDGTVVLKVCDFGIAKRVESDVLEASTELTRTGGLLGSPIYMSPEHAKNAKNVDARSDVWSLGLSLHETLSGRRPWQGCTSVGEVIVAICTEPGPPLAEIAPWVDASLVGAIERCLVRDAAARWQSIADFGAALAPFGLGRAVKLGDLAPVDDAARRQSSRAISVLPPGAVTSGSLRGASSNTSAPASQPVTRGGGWRWAVLLAAAVGLGGGGVVIAKSLGGSTPAGSNASAAASPPPMVSDVVPSASVAGRATTPASASAAPSASTSASAVGATATGHLKVPTRGVPSSVASAAAPASAPSARPPTAPASASVGRGFTATDLPP